MVHSPLSSSGAISGATPALPSGAGSAALLRRSVSVGFPQYPTDLLAVLSVRRAARCALTEIDLVTAREPGLTAPLFPSLLASWLRGPATTDITKMLNFEVDLI